MIDLWNETCYVNIERKDSSNALDFETKLDGIDISGLEQNFETLTTMDGSQVYQINPRSNITFSITGYVIGIGLDNNLADLGFTQLFYGTEDTTRPLNSSPSLTPDLFKITVLWTTASVSNAKSGITQESATSIKNDVIQVFVNTPPTSPNDGDRYVVGNNPSGSFSGHSLEITEYDSGTSSWGFTTPSSKDVVYSINDRDGYMYTGSTWTLDFDFFQAYRIVAEDLIVTQANRQFSDRRLLFDVEFRGSIMNESASSTVTETGILGKNDLTAITGAY